MNWLAVVTAADAAADLLLHLLDEERAKQKIAERAAILAARAEADKRAAEKFGEPRKV